MRVRLIPVLLVMGLCWPLSAGAVQFGAGSGSSYPTTLDTINTRANKSGGACSSATASNICAEFTNDLQGAIHAIQLELGTLPKGAFADVATRLNTGLQTPWTTNIVAAGYTLYGSASASGNLTLDSTSHGTKGYAILNPSGGNVGIGTTSPAKLLHLSTASFPTIELQQTTQTTKGYFYGKGTDLLLTVNQDEGGAFSNANATATSIDLAAVNSDGWIIFSTSPTNNTSPTERMRIDKNGNVGIGTTTPGVKLDVTGNQSVTGYLVTSGYVYARGTTGTALRIGYDGGNDILQLSTNANLYLSANGEGSVVLGTNSHANLLTSSSDGNLAIFGSTATKASGTAWANPSDRRLKEHITDYTDGLAVLKRVRPVQYELNGLAGTPKGQKGISVIAQEMLSAMPYTIQTYKAKLHPEDTETTELYRFEASAMTFALVNAVKELDKRLIAIETQTRHSTAKQRTVH